jgi:hypothetical protein
MALHASADESVLFEARMAEREPAPPLLASVANEQNAVPIQQRIVVYNAGLRMVVTSVEDALKHAERIAAELQGYVQEIKGEKITVRVPADTYKAALERLSALGQVVERELQALDVTEEYVDLEARLNNARNVRKRFEALLERAETTDDAVIVERELGRVTEEIERLEGKLALLRNRVAFSTISVKFERVARQISTISNFRQLPFGWLRELDPNRLWAGY